MRSSLLAVAAACALLAAASPAAAHLSLTSPPSRYGGSVLKEPPCGMSGGTRSDNVTVFEPGQTIELVWDEYIDHPGHYRVAFDADGDDDFVDPATMTEEYSNDAVLLDGIEDRDVSPGDSEYRVTVTLPDIECESCTLQVIQVMYDKPPYTIPGNDLYYQCADLVLRRSGGTDAGATGADAGSTGTDAGSTTPDAGSGGGTDAGGTTDTRRSDGGCSVTTVATVAAGTANDPLAALGLVGALVAMIVLRRRPRA